MCTCTHIHVHAYMYIQKTTDCDAHTLYVQVAGLAACTLKVQLLPT